MINLKGGIEMFPTIKDVEKALKEIKKFELDPGISDLDVTLAWRDKETGGPEWIIQIGDNSMIGSAYFFEFWAVNTLDRRTNCHELAKNLINELKNLYYQ